MKAMLGIGIKKSDTNCPELILDILEFCRELVGYFKKSNANSQLLYSLIREVSNR